MTSHWNYRVVRHPAGNDHVYRIHEMYYDNDVITMWSDASAPSAETLTELIADLTLMSAAVNRPELDAADLPVPRSQLRARGALADSGAGRSAAVLIEVFPIGRPGCVRLAIGNVGPQILTREEIATTLRMAANQLEGRDTTAPEVSHITTDTSEAIDQ